MMIALVLFMLCHVRPPRRNSYVVYRYYWSSMAGAASRRPARFTLDRHRRVPSWRPLPFVPISPLADQASMLW
jgi:hypothetical protein